WWTLSAASPPSAATGPRRRAAIQSSRGLVQRLERALLDGLVVDLAVRRPADRLHHHQLARRLVAGEMVAHVVRQLGERRLGAALRLDDGADPLAEAG